MSFVLYVLVIDIYIDSYKYILLITPYEAISNILQFSPGNFIDMYIYYSTL